MVLLFGFVMFLSNPGAPSLAAAVAGIVAMGTYTVVNMRENEANRRKADNATTAAAITPSAPAGVINTSIAGDDADDDRDRDSDAACCDGADLEAAHRRQRPRRSTTGDNSSADVAIKTRVPSSQSCDGVSASRVPVGSIGGSYEAGTLSAASSLSLVRAYHILLSARCLCACFPNCIRSRSCDHVSTARANGYGWEWASNQSCDAQVPVSELLGL